MMAALAAKERTLSAWIALGAEAGLEYVRVFVNIGADNGVVEFERRGEGGM
jgi:hypothetical protein